MDFVIKVEHKYYYCPHTSISELVGRLSDNVLNRIESIERFNYSHISIDFDCLSKILFQNPENSGNAITSKPIVHLPF